jgi:hypothetical protein
MPRENKESPGGPTTTDRGGAWAGLKEVVKRLQEQAYLFVIGLVILVIMALYLPAQNVLVTLVALLGALGLGTFAIFSVERRKDEIKEEAKKEVSERSVITPSAEARKEVEGLQDERSAIEGLLEGIVSNDEDTNFIYSSTIVDKVYDHSEPPREIHQPFYSPGNRPEVTTILDTLGIAEIYSLLHVSRKVDRLYVDTAESFQPTNWNSNLILIGSGNSNPKTDEALELAKCPFVFSSDESAIEKRVEGTPGEPSRFEHTPEVDHAILAKLKRRTPKGTRVYLVVAGIGAYGTVAACSFLHEKVSDLYDRFKDSPFALILQVNPEQWTIPREVAHEDLRVVGE